MSSLFLDTKMATYRLLRAASQGASVSLLHKAGEYVATFGCATSIASALGTTATDEQGVPTYHVPLEDVASVCAKLATKLSVALLDVGMVRYDVQFVLVWKIPCVAPVSFLKPLEINLDEY